MLRRHDQFERVFIAPNQTGQTNLNEKSMQSWLINLRERKTKGETNLIIRNGCIITRPSCTASNPPSPGIDHALVSVLLIPLLTGQSLSKDITILYTNADQFLNKINDLKMLIVGSEPDLILITKILP